MADAVMELARRGHRVVVLTSDRGYDNPTQRYPRREIIGGVEVKRLPFTSFGKSRGYLRALGACIFMVRCLADGLFRRDLAGIIFHTSPPFIGVIAALIGRARGCPIAYWAMDLNPEQLIALEKIKPDGLAAKILGTLNDFVLRESTVIVALDRFMVERMSKHGDFRAKTVVIPPWPHEEPIVSSDGAPTTKDRCADSNPFRARHALENKLVIMYSGNHSPVNPLTTLLEAIVRFKDDDSLAVVFVGGGLGKKEVDDYIVRYSLTNVLSLPYQPMSELPNSLSAADVHIVSLGEGMTGIVHPCKVYGAMSVARPILYLGPDRSHVADFLAAHDIGWHVSHGDVEGAVRTIDLIRQTPLSTLREKGERAALLVQQELNQVKLRDEFCDLIESRILGEPTLSTSPQLSRRS